MRLDRRAIPLSLGFVIALGATPLFAGDVSIVAKVDKTTVEVGQSLTLTITVSGEVGRLDIPAFEFPPAFRVAAKSQASNLSIRLGEVERSISLVYVLMPQEPGTFQLGPFQVMHREKPIETDPIEITVIKPVLPPSLEESQRYTL